MTDQIEDQDFELDEEIEEAHDPKNAEAAAVASVKAGEGKAPKAKGRKGDKAGGDKAMPKVTPGTPEKATAGIKTTNPSTNVESVEVSADFSDDINALVEGEATLSEEFKEKTALIFEAALKSKLAEEIDRLEESYANELAEEVATTKADLVEKVDSYLSYVVENWMEENRLAIETGLRNEIAEGFMGKLKDLFVESYIDVPDSKIDIVDELALANEQMEEKVNAATEQAMALSEEIKTLKREAIIREASRDLAETQVEKLKKLAENVDFDNADAFASKIDTLKESYFASKTVTAGDIALGSDEADAPSSMVATGSMMEQYVNAIQKSSK